MTICPYCGKESVCLTAEDEEGINWWKCNSCRRFFQHRVQETSKEAYKQIKESGVEESQKVQVLNYLKENPDSCLREIGEGLHIEKSSISARLNALEAEGKVYRTGNKVYKNNTVTMWRSGERE